MIITISNQWTVLERDSEPSQLLKDIQDHFSYNDDVKQWEKVNEQVFDVENKEHLGSIIEDVKGLFFQNYICYHLTGEQYNKYHYDTEKEEWGLWFKRWQMSDGYKSVLKISNAGRRLKIRSGLLRRVLQFIQSPDKVEDYGEVLYDFKDQRRNSIRLTDEPVYSVGKFDLREDQMPVIDKMRSTLLDRKQLGQYFTSVLLDLAVNFGKSVLSGAIINNIKSPKVLLPFRDVGGCAKAVVDYIQMGFIVSVIAADKATIKALLKSKGVEIVPNWDVVSDFTICMVQTVEARIKSGKILPEQFLRFNVGMYDECEEFTSKQSLKFIDRTFPGLQVGYSGTSLKSPSGKNRYTVLGLFGSQRYKVTTEDNVSRGVSLEPHMHMILNKFYGGKSLSIGRAKRDKIYLSEGRYELMLDALKELQLVDKQIVIYFGAARIEYGDWLYYRLFRDIGLNKVGYLHGGIAGADRVEVLDRFISGNIQVLVANRIIKKRLNIPNIEVWVNWESTGNEISFIQGAIGRGSRKDGDATKFDIIGFFDQGHKGVEKGSKRLIKELSQQDHGVQVEYLYEHNNGVPVGCE